MFISLSSVKASFHVLVVNTKAATTAAAVLIQGKYK
jgi:hypothetical protein